MQRYFNNIKHYIIYIPNSILNDNDLENKTSPFIDLTSSHQHRARTSAGIRTNWLQYSLRWSVLLTDTLDGLICRSVRAVSTCTSYLSFYVRGQRCSTTWSSFKYNYNRTMERNLVRFRFKILIIRK